MMIWLQNAALRPIASSGHKLAFEEANPTMLLPLVTITKFDVILMLRETGLGLMTTFDLWNILRNAETLKWPEESAKDMYDKVKAEILKQSSGSSAFSTRIELILKKFKDALTFDNFEKHLTFYRSKNASLIAVNVGFDDSFLAFLLLYSFNSLEDPVWSMVSMNIATSDIPINQWSFNQIAGKLRTP